MKNHFQLTDEAFETAIRESTLHPSLFSHEAHLRLAWIHIGKYGVDQAIVNICDQLKRYVYNIGAARKYNSTVTIAAIRAVFHFRLKSVSTDFFDFIQEFPNLKNNFRSLLAQHYSIDIFGSEKAKQSYLEPDLLPFD
ncbi:MAG: hypothetical protein KJN76_03855 [Eudoraea sp.]|nr:hypothetical protein [Eudoraea sp.]